MLSSHIVVYVFSFDSSCIYPFAGKWNNPVIVLLYCVTSSMLARLFACALYIGCQPRTEPSGRALRGDIAQKRQIMRLVRVTPTPPMIPTALEGARIAFLLTTSDSIIQIRTDRHYESTFLAINCQKQNRITYFFYFLDDYSAYLKRHCRCWDPDPAMGATPGESSRPWPIAGVPRYLNCLIWPVNDAIGKSARYLRAPQV
jgi:hypothetical protein